MNYLIIGGGFSGIAAARILHSAGKSFLLLEARNRLGGRVHTYYFDHDQYLELGGQWIGPTQNRMYELAREHSMAWFETFNQGKNIIALNERIRTYYGLIPKIDIASLLNIQYVLTMLEKKAACIPLNAPWKAKNARLKDSTSLDNFIRRHCYTKNAYRVMTAGLETVFACNLNEISLLHALFYIKSGVSLNTLLSIENGAQLHRLKGGMQQLIERMAEPFRDSVRLGHAVRKIHQYKDKVLVQGENFSYESDRIIIALPPVSIRQLAFEPALPLQKQQLLQKLFMGIVGKVFGVYAVPFWRSKGFSGQVVADEGSFFQTLFDVSPPDARYGVLLAFCLADRARKFFSLHPSERENIAIHTFQRYFGNEATNYIAYRDHCWADEAWSGGCYAGIYPTGAWTSFRDELARPWGRIHWAGTETSAQWYGYIEGAVRAGERAAREILICE